MWELYDALTASVEPGHRLLDLAVGAEWTAVLSEDGGLGLAPTIREAFRRFDSSVKAEKGMDLSELAAAARAWDYYDAALGLAAVNAVCNRAERLPAGAVHRPGGRRSLSAFLNYCKENLGGKHSLLIDPMYLRENLNNVPGIFDITRRETTYRDFPSCAYLELVPACDQLIMSGTPLVDKYAPLILQLAGSEPAAPPDTSGTLHPAAAVPAGSNGNPHPAAAAPAESNGNLHPAAALPAEPAGVSHFVSGKARLWGMDVPMAPVLKEFNVQEITCFLADDPEKILWTVKRGGSRDDILKLGHFATVKL